jgi:hypothetical protein
MDLSPSWASATPEPDLGPLGPLADAQNALI